MKEWKNKCNTISREIQNSFDIIYEITTVLYDLFNVP